MDRSGRAIWTRAVPTPRGSDAIGGATDPQALFALIEDMIIEGWQAVGKGKPLTAIATTGVGEDGIYVDGNLKPLGPAIPWFDRRATEQAAFIRSTAAATPRAGIAMDHTRTGAKWLWMRQEHPEVVLAARCWVALTDHPSVIWTRRPFMSETLASRTGCYDVGARTWLPRLLETCGAPPLPEILRAGEIVGTVSFGSLIESGAATIHTIVAAGGHDHPIAASAIQRIDPMARIDSIGTANVVYAETRSFPLDHFDPFLSFMVPVRATDGIIACLGVFEFSSAVQALQADGVDVRAFLNLPRMPGKPSLAKPLLKTTELTRNLRSVLEGESLTARQMFDNMNAVGVEDGPIYATGGWSRSRSLLELRASIYGKPIRVLSEQEPAVIGAALLAAGAADELIDFSQGITIETIDPDANWATFYQEHYQDFCKQLQALDRPGRERLSN
ncbi:FGGY-family carbohydrate kinase [Phyllobacterium zundukense]|uniref:FGGY family carbohydrate kinase n=1 Tax=Phyllobacterium zundukense TaxID=1867719 RepID=A0ACD4CW45_9HYPH|nr:FGGY family carbohydrate kinase [Phyllobacterium zundukense]UXN57820.1 FGGY family carbohydrate kinase [Phyllobacterium zundukense]